MFYWILFLYGQTYNGDYKTVEVAKFDTVIECENVKKQYQTVDHNMIMLCRKEQKQ